MKKFMRYYLTFIYILAMSQSIVFATDGGDEISTISGKLGQILNALSWFGTAISLGMLMYIGAKYTMSAANERATLKEGSINYIIGAFLILGASAITGIIASLAYGGDGETSSVMAEKILDAAKSATGSN